MRNIFILTFALIAFLPLANPLAQESTPPTPMPLIERAELTIKTSPDDPVAIEQTSKKTESQQHENGAAQKLNLSAKISETGSILQDSVTWRIFDAVTEQEKQMSLLYKSDEAIVSFDLKPGDYLIHVSYGFAQTSEAVHIEDSPITKVLNLEAGALRLNGAISGDIPILPKNLYFDIKTADFGSNSQTEIVNNVRVNEIIYLNAGTYNITSYYGNINAQVKADLRVETGKLTQATLYHDAGAISFRLASEQNGKPIADVEWVVKDKDGNIVYSELGAFPFAILSEGDYSVIAKIGQKVYNRDFQVIPAPPREIELLTSVY